MWAIIKTGGKQYRVAEGDVIDVELLDAELGSRVEFSEVLFYSDGSDSQVGSPFVSGISVVGELLSIASGPKVTSMKYKPSHHQHRKFGHRQKYSRIKISEIGGKKKKKEGKHGT